MARYVVDCRETPSPNRLTGRDCTLVLTGEEDEVVQAAAEHGVAAHGYEDTTELRDLIRGALKAEVGTS
jgi:hypothetical protein